MSEDQASAVRRIIARLQAPVATLPAAWMLEPLAPEQQAELARLALDANSQLETAASEAAARGFNLGCSTGLLPGGFVTLLMLFFTGWSFIGAALGLALTLTSMVAFASLAASVTRRNTLRRLYTQTIQPDLAQSLRQAGLTQAQLVQAAFETLPPAAPLLAFLSPTVSISSPEMPS